MGLFSTKKKTHVYTSVNRMIEDTNIVNSNAAAIAEYTLQSTLRDQVLSKSNTLADYINLAATNSLPAKWGRAYRKAKGGNYAYGLPESNVIFHSSPELDDAIAEVITNIVGGEYTLVYSNIGEPNYYHIAWQQLLNDYGYSYASNELMTLSNQYGVPVYLKDMVINYSDDTVANTVDTDAFAQWGISATAGATQSRKTNLAAVMTGWTSGGTEDFVKVTVTLRGSESLNIQGEVSRTPVSPGIVDIDATIQFGFTDFVDTDDYVMVSYIANGNRNYFTYLHGSGEYPLIDNALDTKTELGQFYPRIYARLNYTNLASESLADTEAYTSSKALCRKLDLDWVSWVNELHDNMDNTGSVCQMFTQIAVSANENDPDIAEYLYKYFTRLYKSSERSVDVTAAGNYTNRRMESVEGLAMPGMSIRIQDKAYTQILSFSSIGVTERVGKVCEVGKYTNYRKTITDKVRGFGFLFRTVTTQNHVYAYQVTETTYREVYVSNLALTEQVLGGNTTVSSGDSDSLLIPVDFSMRTEMSVRKFETVVSKGLHLIVNTVQVVKTKWYQTGVFKVIMFVVAVVMAWWTGGASLTFAAVATAVAQAVAIIVITTVLAKVAIKLGLSAGALAVIAVIIALVAGYANFSSAGQVAGVSARTMLQASNIAFNVQSTVQQHEIHELQKKMQAFEAYTAEKEQQFEDIKAGLNTNQHLLDNALWISSDRSALFYNLGESAEDYYTRTVYSGNIGVAAITMSLNSVELALALPSFNQTLQRFQGGNL